MDDKELDRLEELAQKATPGPWKASVGVYYAAEWPDDDNGDCYFGRGPTSFPQSRAIGEADAAFIAAAREAVPALIAEVRRLREEKALCSCGHPLSRHDYRYGCGAGEIFDWGWRPCQCKRKDSDHG